VKAVPDAEVIGVRGAQEASERGRVMIETTVAQLGGAVKEDLENTNPEEEFGLVEGPLGHLAGELLEEHFYSAAIWEQFFCELRESELHESELRESPAEATVVAGLQGVFEI
jgi:hypothetical protein